MKMRHRIILPILSVLTLAIFMGQPAGADGSGAVSTASELPLGIQVTGGAASVNSAQLYQGSIHTHENTPGVQFWKVNLALGDRLVVDYGVVTGSAVDLCVLAPAVTDYTLIDSQCVAQSLTQSKQEFIFTAPQSGEWFLVVEDYTCCQTEAWAYQLTASVYKFTNTTIVVPTAIHVGSAAKVSGTVSGGGTGSVTLQSANPRWHGWKTVSHSAVQASGAYQLTTRLKLRGVFRVRVAYSGDSTHLPSTSGIKSISVR